ncbi:hypothetical protein OIU34_19075 [Pararhizobium sp. BT-229]|uniref:hypothetical protein n=1 Tax=Pararhizobium sp. BT-229 TaxID=2986923 RepID=UPI0021F74B70|nr:hypothetical protein [Pararhizobium sp. BT-229]MCV9963985.1 hypothetical protein [Pararhizobium sp. BT-229]
MAKPILREITEHICGLDQDGRVQLLLTYCLGRLFMREHGKGGDWRALAASVDGGHIADWLRAAVANGDPWLSNVDELDRPRKLMKFGSVQQVAAEADKAMAKANQAVVGHVADGEEFVMDLGNGMYVVRLLTPEALDYESSVMQHCIGHGGYDYSLSKNDRHFFSLRSGSAKPHVTIDIDVASGWVNEMKGKQNAHPDPAYVMALTPFFKSRPELQFMRHTGLVFDQHRNLVHVRSLPDGTVLEGDLRINGGAELVLPKNLTVKGDMEITFVKKVTLPENLNVGGTFMIEACAVEGRIENLVVEGWSTFFVDLTHAGPSFLGRVKAEHVGFDNTQMTELPEMEIESLAVERMPIADLSAVSELDGLKLLRLTELPNVKELPAPTALGQLEVYGMPIRDFCQLPDAHYICFSDMDIGLLPENLTIAGTLTFNRCKLAAIPGGLTVGNIAFIETKAPGFPDDIVIRAAGHTEARPTAAMG